MERACRSPSPECCTRRPPALLERLQLVAHLAGLLDELPVLRDRVDEPFDFCVIQHCGTPFLGSLECTAAVAWACDDSVRRSRPTEPRRRRATDDTMRRSPTPRLRSCPALAHSARSTPEGSVADGSIVQGLCQTEWRETTSVPSAGKAM